MTRAQEEQEGETSWWMELRNEGSWQEEEDALRLLPEFKSVVGTPAKLDPSKTAFIIII